MANSNPLDALDQILAEIYVALKRHEKVLLDLTADVEALRNTLAGAEYERFAELRKKAFRALEDGHTLQGGLYDAIIAKLRGSS